MSNFLAEVVKTFGPFMQGNDTLDEFRFGGSRASLNGVEQTILRSRSEKNGLLLDDALIPQLASITNVVLSYNPFIVQGLIQY